MTTQQLARKTMSFLARLKGEGGLDVVAFANGDHLALFGTAPIRGRREIVSIELQPWAVQSGASLEARRRRGKSLSDEELRKLTSWRRRLDERMRSALDHLEETPTENLAPISTSLLRGIPLTKVLEDRLVEVRRTKQFGRALRAAGHQTSAGVGELGRKDEQRLAYLDDALIYVAALEEGRSPAEEIAKERGIAKRTAETRIARTRELGLLTAAERRRASGELTEAAIKLKAWADRAKAG